MCNTCAFPQFSHYRMRDLHMFDFNMDSTQNATPIGDLQTPGIEGVARMMRMLMLVFLQNDELQHIGLCHFTCDSRGFRELQEAGVLESSPTILVPLRLLGAEKGP